MKKDSPVVVGDDVVVAPVVVLGIPPVVVDVVAAGPGVVVTFGGLFLHTAQEHDGPPKINFKLFQM